MIARSLMVAALVAFALPAGADQIYRWTDNAGNVHYGDNPPSGVEARRVRPDDAGVVETPSAPGSQSGDGGNGGGESAEAGQAEEPERTAGPTAEERAEQCRKIRERLTTLQNNPRLLIQGEDGETRRMPEDERQKRIDEFERMLDEDCADGSG